MFLLTVSFMFSYGFKLPSSVFHFSSPDSIISHRAGLLMTNCLLFVTGDVFISVWFWRKAQGFDRSLFSCYVVSDSFVTPWTISLPGSSARGIFQARILEWVAISCSRGSSPGKIHGIRDQAMSLASPALAGGFFTTEPPCEAPLTNITLC